MAIPRSAAPFFQEYDFDSLDPHEDARLIIERVLAYGNRAELRWLVENYGWPLVKDWIAESGSRRLPWSRYRLWCVVFDIPPEERPRGVWQH